MQRERAEAAERERAASERRERARAERAQHKAQHAQQAQQVAQATQQKGAGGEPVSTPAPVAAAWGPPIKALGPGKGVMAPPSPPPAPPTQTVAAPAATPVHSAAPASSTMFKLVADGGVSPTAVPWVAPDMSQPPPAPPTSLLRPTPHPQADPTPALTPQEPQASPLLIRTSSAAPTLAAKGAGGVQASLFDPLPHTAVRPLHANGIPHQNGTSAVVGGTVAGAVGLPTPSLAVQRQLTALLQHRQAGARETAPYHLGERPALTKYFDLVVL